MTPPARRTQKGMSLLEVMIVVAIFAALAVVINSVIISAQSMWSATYPYSTLEEEALKIFKQLKGDLASSAVMQPPSSVNFADDSLLPHISIDGGNSTDGYFGNSIAFLIPKYSDSGEPIITVSNGDLEIDWVKGSKVVYSQEEPTEGFEQDRLVRTVTNNTTGETTASDITRNLVSIEFRDHDTSPNTLTNFYTVKISLVLRRRTFTNRMITVKRETIAYLRNSRGADDLGDY